MSRPTGTARYTLRRLLHLLLVASMLALLAVATPAAASPDEYYSGPHFGDGNYPADCAGDFVEGTDQFWYVPGEGGLAGGESSSLAVCHHMRTDMNYLDSPQIDVLILVPASEPERSMRLARQSIEMWEGGIQYLAEQMGLDWLAEGVDFHITVDQIDTTESDGDGEFTTYPIVDPEIVVVQGVNPVGTLGIGIDPVGLNACHGIQNPFDMQAWENLPGFDSHHDGRSGTYTEDCDGAGGNTCYAVNTTIDTSVFSWDSMFDLVSHEVGHCLSLGHVGDGAEGAWGGLPPDDIMAYAEGGPGTKCVSTLNVEGFAIRMSNYLDLDGDGEFTDDVLEANDHSGGYDGDGDPFQVMHPDDYQFASGTGRAIDCPQPDDGLLPGERTDWTPTPVQTRADTLTLTSPTDGTENQSGEFTVAGTVEHVLLGEEEPTSPVASYDDADDDATSPFTEILDLAVEVTDTDVTAAIQLADLVMPSTDGASTTGYSLVVDGHEFESFVYGVGAGEVRTFDATAGAYVDGYSTWDPEAKTVSFTIPRDYLAGFDVTAPYQVSSTADFGGVGASVPDDYAPEGTDTVGVAGPESTAVRLPAVTRSVTTQTFDHDGPYGNTFYSEESTLGVTPFVDAFTGADLVDTTHFFELDVSATSDVEFRLTWTDAMSATTDLDLYITGAADSGSLGATTTDGEDDLVESVVLEDVKGSLDIAVEPYLVTDPVAGTTYSLTAVITTTSADTDGDGVPDADDLCVDVPGTAPSGCPDTDGDGVHDGIDACPAVQGEGADGCPVDNVTEWVEVYVGGTQVGRQAVDTTDGPADFSIALGPLAEGAHTLQVEWIDEDGDVLASTARTVLHDVDDDDDGVLNVDDVCGGFDDHLDEDGDGIPDGCDPDLDGDGVANLDDNCLEKPNPDQADLDGDGRGDACDPDLDGDGHANGKERAHGTDPADPDSYPTKGNHT